MSNSSKVDFSSNSYLILFKSIKNRKTRTKREPMKMKSETKIRPIVKTSLKLSVTYFSASHLLKS